MLRSTGRSVQLKLVRYLHGFKFEQLQQAIANVKMREAASESARVDLQRTTIYAPLDGMVISRSVDAGQTVASSFSTPTLFAIANDLSKMHIELAVSEADIGSVEQGQRIEFQVDAFQNRKFNGTVKQVRYHPTTNQSVISYITVIEVNNPDLKLRPGMYAMSKIAVEKHDSATLIPVGALVMEKTNAFVFKHVDGKAMKTAVKIGFNDGTNVEVPELKADDVVLVPGTVALTDKQAVSIKAQN
jgi:RND family efflux transporter MFP subunit